MARASKNHFQFKQFRIEQNQCAMKVTSDACIFGARAEVEHSSRILDIGAGSGLLSLMTAQRSAASIDALEIDELAATQAEQNFSNSPWVSRLKLIHSSVQEYQSKVGYDTIICNPPFFHNSLKAPNSRRNMARHTDALSFSDLAEAIARLLIDEGKAWILLPVESTKRFLEASENNALRLLQTIKMRSTKQREDHRHILVVGKVESEAVATECLTIYSEPSVYSDQIQKLMQSYYLFL